MRTGNGDPAARKISFGDHVMDPQTRCQEGTTTADGPAVAVGTNTFANARIIHNKV
jgi:hypothetical protein